MILLLIAKVLNIISLATKNLKYHTAEEAPDKSLEFPISLCQQKKIISLIRLLRLGGPR